MVGVDSLPTLVGDPVPPLGVDRAHEASLLEFVRRSLELPAIEDELCGYTGHFDAAIFF